MQLSVSLPPSPSVPSPSAPAPLADNAAAAAKGGPSFDQLLPKAGPPAPRDKKPDATPTTAQQEAAAAVMAGWNQLPASPPLPTVTLPKVAPAVVAATHSAEALGVRASALPAATPATPVASALVPAAPDSKAAAVPAAAALKPATTTVAVPVGAKAAAPSTAPAPTPPAGPAVATAAPTPALAQGTAAAAAETQGAKIAVRLPRDSTPGAPSSKGISKKIQNAEGNGVTSTSAALGTAVAKVAPVMTATATTERHASVPSVPEVASVGSSSSGPSLTPSSAPTETASTAQGAVQAAITAAELVSGSASGKAVNLQFSMGNADLNLRVELVNGQIHATFATDSAQLRSDLAHEWQSSTSTAGHASLNLATPTFTAASNGQSLASGDQAPSQRGRDAGEAATPYGSVSSSVSPAAADDDMTPRVPVSLASSQHLQTFA